MAYLDENGLEHFWGKIKDHVDSAIAPKANDADVVHKTGTETISGEKVFSGSHTLPSGNHASALLVVKDPDLVKGETPATNHYLSLGFIDSTGDSYAQDTASRLGVVEYKSPSEADPEGFMQLYDVGFNGGGAILRVGHDKDNIRFASAPATSDGRTNTTDIVTRGYMEASEWNWQKTKKAGAVTFKPVPESDLEPVVDFMFTETPPAEGEKGPENPSTIAGVSSVKVTRCGKNLAIMAPGVEAAVNVGSTYTYSGITYTPHADGSYTANGTATADSTFYFALPSQNGGIRLEVGQTYTLSGCPSGGSNDTYALRMYPNVAVIDTGSGGSFTAQVSHSNAYILIKNGVTVNNLVFRPQIELGGVITSYEPPMLPSQIEYTTSFNGTYYGGSLDVATGVMTVTNGKFLIDENCTYYYNASSPLNSETHAYVVVTIPSLPASNIQYSKSKSCCDYLSFSNTAISGNSCIYTTTIDTQYIQYKQIGLILLRSTIGVSSSSTAAEINLAAETWFTEHPAAFVVGFSNSAFFSSVQLTPTQIRSLPALDKYEPRINTVYTDQEAVQVGYQRYANYVDLTTDQTIDGQKTFVEQLFINTGSATYQTGILSSQINGVRFSSEAYFVSSSGAYLDLNGRSASSAAGYFSLGANSSSGSKLLQGKPDGTLTWNGQTIQTTSDERLKTSLSEVPDAVLDAWEDVNWGQFRYLDAVAAKGESARLHLGLIAQHVMSVFEQHGLDACDYGILCHEERPAVDEEETVVDAEAYTDEEGVEHPAVTHVETRHEDAVDLWMVRYAEAQAMEACCMRRENARLKKRIASLEERIAALEAKLS